MKFPERIFLKWDLKDPYLVGTEALKGVVPDEPDLVATYVLISEVSIKVEPAPQVRLTHRKK